MERREEERSRERCLMCACARVWCVASGRTHGRAGDGFVRVSCMTALFYQLRAARECVFPVLIKVGLNDAWLGHRHAKLKKRENS